jgi:hypothetical protein
VVECDDHPHFRESDQQTAIALLRAAAAAACMFVTPHTPLVYGLSGLVDLVVYLYGCTAGCGIGCFQKASSCLTGTPCRSSRPFTSKHTPCILVGLARLVCSCPVAIYLYLIKLCHPDTVGSCGRCQGSKPSVTSKQALCPFCFQTTAAAAAGPLRGRQGASQCLTGCVHRCIA